ncbi:response regulator, partial [uncultured Abyssibacter sp.]|uniref:response regulator n=1 Tax=uncultured Abyssibacter sp. TaxID=2320202 RepID=UPI0032B179C3
MDSHAASAASTQLRKRLGFGRQSGSRGEDAVVRDQLLVVDDEAADRLLIRRILADGATVGLELIEAETAQDAVEQLRGGRIACMLIDHMLPDMTGLDLLSMLANIEPVGLVLISGVMDVPLSRDAIRLGAHDVLPKDDLDTSRLSLSIHAAIG